MLLFNPRRTAAVLALAMAAPLIVACGDDDEEESAKPTTMSITTTDAGAKKFKMAAPASIEGGLVEVRFSNASKVPHEAQLIKLDGGHTVDEALKLFATEKVVLPDWFHAYGGVATTPPGKSGKVTVKLPAGDYAVIDDAADDGPLLSTMGAVASFKVTGDNGGDVKDTAAKVEAEEKGKDKWGFKASGLKAGNNQVTFDNPTKQIHHIVTFPMVGNATVAEVKKFLSTMGRPTGPPPVDFEKGSNTTVIDKKQKQITALKLAKGRNVLVCFLTDRDGKGKSHVANGMIEEVDVK